MKRVILEDASFAVVDVHGEGRDGPIELKVLQMIDDGSGDTYEAALTPEIAKELSEALVRSPADAERAALARAGE